MQPFQQTIAPLDADANGIALSQTPLAGGPLTMNGALVSGGVATLPCQQFPTVTCAGNDAARIFTFTGTGQTGQALTATVAGSSGSVTVSSVGFKTITGVSVDAATADAIEIGIDDVGRQYPCVIDTMLNPTDISVSVDVTDTINFTVQHSFNDPTVGTPDTWTWFNGPADVTSKTADAWSSYTAPPRSIAILINSVTAPGQLVFRVIQASALHG